MKSDRVFACLRMYQALQASMMGSPLSHYLGRLPKWGWMRNGDIFELQMSVLRIEGNGGSAWPTPKATEINESVGAWEERRVRHKMSGPSLSVAVKLWATPVARDMKDNGSPAEFNRNSLPLTTQAILESARNWVPPVHSDFRGIVFNAAERKAHGETRDSGAAIGTALSYTCELAVEARQQGVTYLNPDWVETLMGLPIGWTDLSRTPPDPVWNSTPLSLPVLPLEPLTTLNE